MRGTEGGEGDRGDDGEQVDEDGGQIHGHHHRRGAHRGRTQNSDPDQHPIAANAVGHRRRERGDQSGGHPDQVTMPTAAAPPSRNATTPSATRSAHSDV